MKIFNYVKYIKIPEYENDSMLIELKFNTKENGIFKFNNEIPYIDVNLLDEYTKEKIRMFNDEDINPESLIKFKENRASLRDIEYKKDISGTIYTAKAGEKNYFKNFNELIEDIRTQLFNNPCSRRIFVRIAESYKKYSLSENDKSIDVPCLSAIHYLEDYVKFIFRASDLKNELLTDIITIYNSFVLPVYNKIIPIEIFASTTQNTLICDLLTFKEH